MKSQIENQRHFTEITDQKEFSVLSRISAKKAVELTKKRYPYSYKKLGE
jgi:hypothetical protein